MQRVKNLELFFYNNPQISMPLIVLLWGIYYFFFGAIINIDQGFGYDGYFYRQLTKDFYNFAFVENNLSGYYMGRILPSLIINLFLSVSDIPKEDYVIVRSFQIYNLILIVLSSLIWYKISKIYKLNSRLTWLGFILGFLNFGIAEMSLYDPVLTDITAFFLGFFLLYAHLKNNLIAKMAITFLGAFTWPSFIYYGILLIIFPVDFKTEADFKKEKAGNKYLNFLLPLPFLIIALYYINIYFSTGTLWKISTEIISPFFYISAVLNFLLMSYFFFIFLPSKWLLSSYLQFFRKGLLKIKIKNVVICVLLFMFIKIIQIFYSSDMSSGTRFLATIYYISLYSSTKPFVYIVTATTYFGPCFILLFLYLKNFKFHLKDLGLGVYGLFIITFIMTFISETRQIINFFPFIILLSVLVFRDFKMEKSLFLLLIIFSFILSKVYIPLFNVPVPDLNNFQFPNQLFFMNSYMISNHSYYIQLSIVIFMIVCILFILKRNNYNQFHTR